MRLFLFALVAAAAGIGYVYTHREVPAAEPRPPARPRLFDWQSTDDTVAALSDDGLQQEAEPPHVVRDTIHATRTEITSVLDEFVRVSGEAPPPSDESDIVSHADLPEAGNNNADLIPFASSDNVPKSDIVPETEVIQEPPADASAAVDAASANVSSAGGGRAAAETAGAERPAAAASARRETTPAKPAASDDVKDDVKTAARESARPAINEATIVTQPPATEPAAPVRETADSPRRPAPPAAKATESKKIERLAGGKSPGNQGLVDADWKAVGKSINQLPIHTRRFGRQGTRTLVIAGLDGRDVIATRWNDELAGELARQSDLFQSNEILILRAGNPDGLVRRMATNVRGTLINRNFPSRRYQFLTDQTAGRGPASEVETHVILDVLYTFRPRRVIHLSSTNGRSTTLYNRTARPIATELQKQFQWTAQPMDMELVPGSIEEFADGTLDASVLSLQLNAGSDWRKAWNSHCPGLLAALDAQHLDRVLAVSSGSSQSEPAGTRIEAAEEEPAPVRKPRRGYEELPPPPR